MAVPGVRPKLVENVVTHNESVATQSVMRRNVSATPPGNWSARNKFLPAFQPKIETVVANAAHPEHLVGKLKVSNSVVNNWESLARSAQARLPQEGDFLFHIEDHTDPFSKPLQLINKAAVASDIPAEGVANGIASVATLPFLALGTAIKGTTTAYGFLRQAAPVVGNGAKALGEKLTTNYTRVREHIVSLMKDPTKTQEQKLAILEKIENHHAKQLDFRGRLARSYDDALGQSGLPELAAREAEHAAYQRFHNFVQRDAAEAIRALSKTP